MDHPDRCQFDNNSFSVKREDLAIDADSLPAAEARVACAKELRRRIFKEAKRMAEYKRVLRDKSRVEEFRAALREKARRINRTLKPPLNNADVVTVTDQLVDRVAKWEHSSRLQRARQAKQAAARRKKNRGRDLQIVLKYQNGMSQRAIAESFGISRGAVRNILERDLPTKSPKSHLHTRYGIGRLPVAGGLFALGYLPY